VKLEPDHLVGLDGVRDAFGKGRIGETKAVLGAPQLDITSSTAQLGTQLEPDGLRELSITDFQFDAQYQQAVESKQVAEQRALTATNDLARIKVEAQQAEAKAAQSSIWAKSRRPLGADQRWSFTRLASLGSNDS
jgi:hypothetical protein